MNSYLEAALEEVTECILDFGCYPQPKRVGMFLTTGTDSRKRFDLTDFVIDHVDPVELAEYFVVSMNDHSNSGAFSYQRDKWTKKIQALLDADATVQGLAQELADKRRAEDEETDDDATNDPRHNQSAEINRSRP